MAMTSAALAQSAWMARKDCHGRTGRGDGVAADTLTPKPPDLTGVVVRSQTDGELFWKIGRGRNGMPGYARHPEEDRWALIAPFHVTLPRAC